LPAYEITHELIERYRKIDTPTIWSALHTLYGYGLSFMQGVDLQTPGRKLVGRARTVRFVPSRPDLLAETGKGQNAPETHAMNRCGPGDVLVCDVNGVRYGSSGGDMKLLQLKMNRAEGIVTDGAIRDLSTVRKYGYIIYAKGGTPSAALAPWPMSFEENVVIGCGGIAVRPGDLIVGDDDGVMCVPQQWAVAVADWSEEHNEFEEIIKERVIRENVPPMTYYNSAMFDKLKKEKEARKK